MAHIDTARNRGLDLITGEGSSVLQELEKPNFRISRTVNGVKTSLRYIQGAPLHSERKRQGKDVYWVQDVCPQVEGLPLMIKSEIDRRVATDLLMGLRDLASFSHEQFRRTYMPTDVVQAEVLLVLSQIEADVKQADITEIPNKVPAGLWTPEEPSIKSVDLELSERVAANEASVGKLNDLKKLVTGTREFTLDMGQQIYELVKDMHISETEMAIITLLRRRTRENSVVVDALVAFVFKEKADIPLKKHLVGSLQSKFKKKDLRGEGKATIAATFLNDDIGAGLKSDLGRWKGRPVPLQFPMEAWSSNS